MPSIHIITGSRVQTATETGALAGTLPSLAGAFAGAEAESGSLVGTLPSLVGAMSAAQSEVGTLVGTLPSLAGSFIATGLLIFVGTVAATLPFLRSAFRGRTEDRRSVSLPHTYVYGGHAPGLCIEELITADDLDRGWAINDPKQAQFVIGVNDPALDLHGDELLQPGNRIVVISRYSKPWVGFLVPVRHQRSTARLELTASSELAILGQRNVDHALQYPRNIGAGAVIADLLNQANQEAYTGIQPAANLQGPSVTLPPLGAQSVLAAMQQVCSYTGMEVWIDHEVDANHITSTLRFGVQGDDLSDALHLYEGIHFSDATHSRDGSPVWQTVEAFTELGMPLPQRSPVTRSASLHGGWRDNGARLETSALLSASALADLPPGMITQTVVFDPMAETAAQLSNRGQREQEYPLPAQETFDDIIALPALSEEQARGLSEGNVFTRHGFFGPTATERLVRVRGVQMDETRGIARVASWSVLS